MEHKTAFLQIFLSIALLVFIIIGIGITTALDQQRFQMEKLSAAITSLTDRMDSSLYQSGNTYDRMGDSPSLPVSQRSENADFFDPKADQGGSFFLAVSSETGNMNMIINNDAAVSDYWSLAYDSLAERHYEEIDRFVPLMAESWSISDDMLTYHIKLRKGILWHDFTDPVTGKVWKNVEVNAHDFKFYVDVIKDEKVNAAPMRSYFSDLKRIDVTNDYEFDVIWERPYLLSKEITLSLIPLPRHFYHDYDGPFDGTQFNDDHIRNRMIVGCGPYQFERWEKGKHVTFSRFEKYYGKKIGIMPPLRNLSFELIQHPNTRLQALRSQTLDADTLTTEQWVNNTDTQEFREDGFLRKMKLPSMAYTFIGLNLKNPLFQERNVRIALSHLVNRKRLIHDVYHDLVRPVSGPFFLDSEACDKTILPHSYDVELAKKLLHDAGWEDSDGDGILDRDGTSFVFTVIFANSNPSDQKLLPILKEDFARAGIKMEILSLEWPVLLDRIEKRQFDAVRLAWRMSVTNDPYQLWHSDTIQTESSSNFISFNNPEADRLIMEIRSCFDDKKRIELYHQFHRLIHEETPYLFLFTPYDLYVINRKFQNVREFPLGVQQKTFWIPKNLQSSKLSMQ